MHYLGKLLVKQILFAGRADVFSWMGTVFKGRAIK